MPLVFKTFISSRPKTFIREPWEASQKKTFGWSIFKCDLNCFISCVLIQEQVKETFFQDDLHKFLKFFFHVWNRLGKNVCQNQFPKLGFVHLENRWKDTFWHVIFFFFCSGSSRSVFVVVILISATGGWNAWRPHVLNKTESIDGWFSWTWYYSKQKLQITVYTYCFSYPISLFNLSHDNSAKRLIYSRLNKLITFREHDILHITVMFNYGVEIGMHKDKLHS